jgi:hypothetical protein
MAEADTQRATPADSPCTSDPLRLLTVALEEGSCPCNRYSQILIRTMDQHIVQDISSSITDYALWTLLTKKKKKRDMQFHSWIWLCHQIKERIPIQFSQ